MLYVIFFRIRVLYGPVRTWFVLLDVSTTIMRICLKIINFLRSRGFIILDTTPGVKYPFMQEAGANRFRQRYMTKSEEHFNSI